MRLALLLVGVVGITLALSMNKGFEWLRDVWPALIGCPQCLGFQLGALLALFWFFRGSGWTIDRVVMSVLVGGVTSLLSYLTYAILHKLGAP